jgi:hypothetical protein
MEKKMLEVEVYVSEGGFIALKQSPFGMPEQVVAFHPDQLDLLITWMQEAKQEFSEIQAQEFDLAHN